MSKRGPKDKPNLQLVRSGQESLPIPQEEARLLQDMLDAWKVRRRGTYRHQEKSIDASISLVRDFVRFSRKAPWRWTAEDFDRWCDNLAVVREVSLSTERGYQIAIRSFLEYATQNIRFRDEVREKFGVPFLQICTDDNCIPHALEREIATERRALTHSEVEIFFNTIDSAIREAAKFGGKDLRPLQRDKAFFSEMYCAGLRISEDCSLDVNSFLEDAEMPEFGTYGRVSLWGKGSKGSGPKHRIVRHDLPEHVATLKWYFEKIRPKFLGRADPNEPAAFLTERGTRVTRGGMEARFQRILDLAGLVGKGFCPQCLRRTTATHGTMWTGPEVQQKKLGHVYQSTTQGYTDIPHQYLNAKVTKATRSLLSRVEDKDGE